MADVDNNRDRETDEWLRLEDLRRGSAASDAPRDGGGAPAPSAETHICRNPLTRDGGEPR